MVVADNKRIVRGSKMRVASDVEWMGVVTGGVNVFVFFFNDTATTEIYTLSLHDALPISLDGAREAGRYEAIRYCIANFGSSDIAWTEGPDAEDGTLTIANDRLLLRGTCTPA